MPDIPAFIFTDFVFSPDIFRNADCSLIEAPKPNTRSAAGAVIRVAGNNNGSFSPGQDLMTQEKACPSGKMVSPVRRINVIPDMPKVIDAAALSVPIAYLSDFSPAVMKRNPPDLFPSESHR